MAPLRIAIIGLEHYHVTGWVDSLEQFPDQIEIVALYDPNPALGERLAPSHHDPALSPALPPHFRQLPFLTDLDQLITQHRPDLALVTLPNKATPAAIERLARAGVHLLIDKPAARTAAEAEAAFAAVHASSVKAAVALTRRYGRGWQDAKAAIAAGRLGRLLSTDAFFVTSSVLVRDPRNQLFDRELSGGGILHWLGVHDLDLLLWLTGERVVEVQAMTATLTEGVEVEEVVSLALRYAGGAVGALHAAYALPRPGNDGYVALRGTDASVKIRFDGSLAWTGPGTIADPVIEQTSTLTSRKVRGYSTGGLQIIDDWLGAIRENRQPLATDDDVINALRIIDAAYESAPTGKRVTVS